MTYRHLSFFVAAVLCLALSVSAQKQQKPPLSGEQADRIEKAHDGLLVTKPGKAAEASRLTAEFAGQPTNVASPVKIPRKNFIDDHIFDRIEGDGIPHAGLATDEEFLRRAYLDATGLLPSSDEVRQFVASKDPDKRDRLVDSLIGTEEFADQWAWFWMDLFQARYESFAYWLKQWLKLDRPYNEVFYDLVTGAAKSHIMIPTFGMYQQPIYNAARGVSPTDQDNYYLMNRLDFVDEVTVNIGRTFLGINMDCFSCHDGAGHTDALNLYLTGKTREEFHRQAAFFGNTRVVATWSDRARNISVSNMIFDESAPGYTTRNDAPFQTGAEARFPRDGKTYEPAFILTGERPRPGANPREELGRILPNHIQFSRAAANLVWGKLMVVGFVEPYDGFDLDRLDPDNPPPKPWNVQPTNPRLLEALAEDFRSHNYSIHRVFKTIMKSSAYQLSTRFPGEWKEAYVPYYARRFARVLTGPEIADALAQATARAYEFNLSGQRVTRVKQLSNPTGVAARRQGPGGGASDGSSVSAIMQAFFQSTRETPQFVTNKTSAVQAMLMMSSPAVNDRVLAQTNNRVRTLLESGKADAEIVTELFLATYSRFPTQQEMDVALRIMGKDPKGGAENILWALLNTPEFLLNH